MVRFARLSLEQLSGKIVPVHAADIVLTPFVADARGAIMRVMETVTFDPDLSSIDTTNLVPGARPVYSPADLTVRYAAGGKVLHLNQDGGISGVTVDVLATGGDGRNDIVLQEDGESLVLDGDVTGVRVFWRNGSGKSGDFVLPTGVDDVMGGATTDVSMSFEVPDDAGGGESTAASGDEGGGGGGGDESAPGEYESIDSLTTGIGGGYGLEVDELLEDLPDPLLDRLEGDDPLAARADESEDVSSAQDMALQDFEVSLLPDTPALEELLRERVAADDQVDDASHCAPAAVHAAGPADAVAHAESMQDDMSIPDSGPDRREAMVTANTDKPQAATRGRELTPLSVVETVAIGKIASLAERARSRTQQKLYPALAL